ncbi:radical SAM protein [Nonomuraea turcica]|uniref:radical SAM protein n=1 Tax=Nonomuraea sp. G32 TaxID=3067274 RepID=UPI00273C344B|nr:radical SAM protein [Nonomuraea sp. G32]MDP4510029.1 radical SAM protein [Nonomuraea sp. G32]
MVIASPEPDLSFIWLEITGKCQLACTHCYAHSGPTGTHGSMSYDDWTRAIDQAAALGVSMVQFIGGEPTLHAGLPGLVAHALSADIEVEVYSNLVHVTPALWEMFARSGVRLATSYYTDDPGQHQQITGRKTLHRTRANIAQAVAMGIPVQVGLIDLRPTSASSRPSLPSSASPTWASTGCGCSTGPPAARSEDRGRSRADLARAGAGHRAPAGRRLWTAAALDPTSFSPRSGSAHLLSLLAALRPLWRLPS